jgi:hypothetical protein
MNKWQVRPGLERILKSLPFVASRTANFAEYWINDRTHELPSGCP